VETAASFEARFAPPLYPAVPSRGSQQPAKTSGISGVHEVRSEGAGLAHELVGRAEQRVVQEGSSPSGAQMRGAISKSGGNSSLAEEAE
jgi:hypothetical protein